MVERGRRASRSLICAADSRPNHGRGDRTFRLGPPGSSDCVDLMGLVGGPMLACGCGGRCANRRRQTSRHRWCRAGPSGQPADRKGPPYTVRSVDRAK